MKRFLIFIIVIMAFSACKEAPNPIATNEATEPPADYMPVGAMARWPDGYHIKVLVPLDSAITTANYTAAHRVNFLAGLAMWDDTIASAGISYEIVTSGTADIVVSWPLTLGGDILGQANSLGTLQMATTVRGQVIPLNAIPFVAVHEFGHSLGIWSHSFDVQDVMFPFFHSGPLSGRDKGTLLWEYKQPMEYDLTGNSSKGAPPLNTCSYHLQ